MGKQSIDLLIRGIGKLYGLHDLPDRPRRGEQMEELGCIEGAAVAIRGGRIVAVGKESELRPACHAAREIDAGGRIAIPGFVDAHTHPVFAGTREREFEMRLRGASYVEIARAGGGILSSVQGVRACSEDELTALVRERLERFLRLGTTALECKSGYGLSTAAELKSLRALRRAAKGCGIHIEATFLGAHEVAPEYRGRRAEYVDLVCAEMIPAVAQEGLARFCDVFAEEHVFSIADARTVLSCGKDHGLGAKIHADQLSALGGAELAVEVGAVSADHLDWISDRGIEMMADSEVIPILLPGVPFFLHLDRDAPARRMIAAGLPVAIATDMNPGSCYSFSMPMMISLACLRLRMTPAEALTAATLNAAYGAGCGELCGSLHTGKRADLLILDLPAISHLAYEFGREPIQMVLAAGQVVHERPAAPGEVQ